MVAGHGPRCPRSGVQPSSAVAVISGGHPGRVLLELAELHPPALGVAVEVLAPLLLRAVEHLEPALDDPQARAVALRAERELDPRRVAVGGVDAAGILEWRPAEREEPRGLHRLDPPLRRAVLAPVHGRPP